MKKLVCLCLTLTAAVASMAQKQGEAPYSTKSFANTGINRVESITSGGNIYVTSVPASEAKVEVYIWPSNYSDRDRVSKEEIEKRLEDYDLKVAMNGNTLVATAKSKKKNIDWKRGLSISFRIFVPREVSTDLTTSGGNISLSKLSGTQDFTTSGGNLDLRDLKGKLIGTTSGGNVSIENSDNDINLTTSGGNITAVNCTGKIKLSTSGGNVDIRELNGNIEATTSGGHVKGNELKGDLEAHTSGGNVTLQNLSCSLETSTSGGNISVSVKELGRFVRVDNSGGNIDLQLPANKGLDLKLSGDKVRADQLNNFSGKVEDEEINGKLNGGGISVSAHASSGRITLRIK